MKKTIVAASIIVLSLVVTLFLWIWTMNVNKGQIKLSNGYDAQVNVVETTMDNMRKTLMNDFKVQRNFADDFIKVVASQASGRTGGALFKANTEAANKLGVSTELYAKMMNAIEGKLAEFKRSQDVLTDRWREHTDYCQDPYHNILWLSLETKVKSRPEMITSDVAKDAMNTKRLDDNLLGN